MSREPQAKDFLQLQNDHTEAPGRDACIKGYVPDLWASRCVCVIRQTYSQLYEVDVNMHSLCILRSG